MGKFLTIMSILRPVMEKAGIVEQIGEACIDAVEEIVTRTDNKVDDALILPVIKGLRYFIEEPKQDG